MILPHILHFAIRQSERKNICVYITNENTSSSLVQLFISIANVKKSQILLHAKLIIFSTSTSSTSPNKIVHFYLVKYLFCMMMSGFVYTWLRLNPTSPRKIKHRSILCGFAIYCNWIYILFLIINHY